MSCAVGVGTIGLDVNVLISAIVWFPDNATYRVSKYVFKVAFVLAQLNFLIPKFVLLSDKGIKSESAGVVFEIYPDISVFTFKFQFPIANLQYKELTSVGFCPVKWVSLQI